VTISRYISLEKFCTISQTYQRYSQDIDPYPWQPESIEAIASLFTHLLDPIIDHFGSKRFILTYGFCSVDLKKFLEKGRNQTCCKIDQHCAHEVNSRGRLICDRLGAAADFRIAGMNSSRLVHWIGEAHLPFDSLYYYGCNRSIHISYGPQHKCIRWRFGKKGQPVRYKF
jgi:hypothetical protein